MSISELIVKGVAVVLILAGLALILGGAGITVFGGAAFGNPILSIILGLILIGIGIWILRGGNITP